MQYGMNYGFQIGRFLGSVIPRGMALFLGLFTICNLTGELLGRRFDANLWWIDIPGCSPVLERIFLGWSAICLLGFACFRQLARPIKLVIFATLAVLLEVSIWNAATVSNLISEGEIQTRYPVTFSALISMTLAFVVCCVWTVNSQRQIESSRQRLSQWLGIVTICAGSALVFPVAQMYCFGGTDYRRSADLIVVLGSRVYSDGTVSAVLEDRIHTGAELFHAGFAPRVLMSGGPGDGAIDEAEAMPDHAVALGIPADRILLDHSGWNTKSTASNTVQLCRERGWKRVLAVSQFYHLPRVKLSFHREGMDVYTVPAEVRYQLRKLPFFMLREVAALWSYYFGMDA